MGLQVYILQPRPAQQRVVFEPSLVVILDKALADPARVARSLDARAHDTSATFRVDRLFQRVVKPEPP